MQILLITSITLLLVTTICYTAGNMYLLFCFLRWNAEDFKISGGIEDKGIHISSDTEISVFVASSLLDASEIESVASSQTSFYVLNHIVSLVECDPDFVSQFFGISASQGGTIVNITSPEIQTSVTLNLHKTYSVIAEDTSINLAGYHVSSSAPITVISGNLCSINPWDETNTLGSYISNHRPVDQYNTEFLVPGIEAPFSSGYDVHVVASKSGTVVNIDSDIHDLDEGEVIVVQFPDRTTPASIACSLPCNVVQFSKGHLRSDGLFMISVLPTTDFYTSAVFSTGQLNNPFHITVVVESSTAVNDLVLDGIIFSPEWSLHENYIYAHETVSQGYHKMTSSESHFALYTYSHTGVLAGGYGYAVRPKKGKGLYILRHLFHGK